MMDINELKGKEYLAKMAAYEKVFWLNPDLGKEACPYGLADIDDAEARLERFAPLILKAFPDTAETGGIIESPLKEIPEMKKRLVEMTGDFPGRLFIKMDSHLKVSGSVKARGGIYEVLKLAEEIAMKEGLLSETDDYSILLEDRFRELFSRYSVQVGSTGNLGLSIGIISAKLGFRVTVHMSADARQWKKDLLRSKGVTVVEYPQDYQVAVAEGRKASAGDPLCHFVDDEGSKDLFFGYSVAAKRLVPQLEEAGIKVDSDNPLYVYIPCGVGGAPGGITFGLKTIFGDNVKVYFAEPTHSPCMTLSLITGLNEKICCADIGLDGKTAADGLACGRASYLVSALMGSMVEGCYTITDEELYPFLAALKDTEGIFIEPSSTASFIGPALVNKPGTHILWATGGSMVPQEEADAYYNKGKNNR
ncbi:MAG: D-serine ammonia-lyase [Firmicutes bacterium]|nr:D-serine ammonia-lyase [Bacillota bacterium]